MNDNFQLICCIFIHFGYQFSQNFHSYFLSAPKDLPQCIKERMYVLLQKFSFAYMSIQVLGTKLSCVYMCGETLKTKLHSLEPKFCCTS